MTKTPAVRGLLAGFVLLVGSVTQAFAQAPSPAQMLDPKLAPKMDDVALTILTPDELKSCSVELIKGAVPNSSGWLLVDKSKKMPDGSAQPIRRFYDSNGDGKVDIWSYYKDGIEVYREFDTTLRGGRPNNFRWLNGGGMKWGVGSVDERTGKAAIEQWRMISAEEVGYEAFLAVAREDFARLRLLFISTAEAQALKLSPATLKKIAEAQAAAPQKLTQIAKKLKLETATFQRVEGYPASCVLEDGPTGEVMVIKYLSRQVQYEQNKKTDWLHTGELIQAGLAWRLVDVPSDIDPTTTGPGTDRTPKSPELERLLDQITELDKTTPAPGGVLAKRKDIHNYLTRRIGLVQDIIKLDKADQREMWHKQLFDNLAALAQNSGDEATLNLLKQLKDFVVKNAPTSNLAAYGSYRDAWTRYMIDMALAEPDSKKISAVQDRWLDQLSEFVKNYSRAEDTPDALNQLAMGCEFAGKDEESKRYYGQLAENFPTHLLTPRARGAVVRLNLPGKKLELAAPLLTESKSFDIRQLEGKVVIVHYWASDSTNFADDFVRLKRVLDQHGQKVGLELVCINLDEDAGKAREALKKVPAIGIHLYQNPPNTGGGLNSPLAIQYGIHMLPTTFMVGRDGRVTNRALQIGDIDTELKKVQ